MARKKKFGVKTMNKMLQNRAYIGEYLHGDIVVEKFLHADFDNPGTLEYFVDKIYLTDDGLVVTSRYSEDRTEITWDMLYGEGDNPLKGKPSSSTVSSLAPPIADNFFM